MRPIPTLVVIAFLVAAAVFVADRPGAVSIVWQGWRIDTSVAVTVLAIVVVTLVVAFLAGLLRRVVSGPRAFSRRRREKRRRAGYRALTQGMVAVAAGDPEEAQRQARKADVLLADPPLTLLLSAQAAQLNGDEDAARKYFTAMLNRPETEFLGLRGLLTQALRQGDRGTALRLAERARSLRPRAEWVLTSLFDLRARERRWDEAQETIAEIIKRKAMPAEIARRHNAALFYERSRAADADGRPQDALQHVARAVSLAPDFTAAVRRHAELLQREGRARQAAKAIEAGWRHLPHPALAEAWDALEPSETALQRVKRMERLAAANASHPESRIALAGAALGAQLWGEARRQLESISVDSLITPRVCRLMARLEEAEHGDHGAARQWLERAAVAPPDPVWLCAECSGETHEWSALCPHCGAFDSLDWKRPARALPVLAPPVPTATLPPPPATSLPAVAPEARAADT
jgi:HemY protein